MKFAANVRAVARLALRRESRADAYYEIRRQILGEPALPINELRRILVVCHGNICRSPHAASLLRQVIPNSEVASAGLFAGDGKPADPTAIAVARGRGIRLEDHRSAPTGSTQIQWADVILVMEGRAAREVARRWPAANAKTRVLGHYLSRRPYAIPDPWGQPAEVFERVFAQLEEAVSRFALRVNASDNAPKS